ncbi:DNA (cytosine-5-)-methyltransferase, partial [Anaerobutyricum hallii]|uniref:DNA (cytosine-5-)-methyltransferase n=1 Tax=Anaerobutyricum hallii TaxID=39488 RepID=UPI0026702E89
SVNGGWDFARLLIEMEQRGYDAEWQLLNSKDFGVPQNRERCFIIGHLRGRGSAEVFPVERADREDSIQIIDHRDGYRRNTQVFAQDGITEALSTCQGGGREHHVALPCFIDLCREGSKMTGQARCLKARYYKGVSNHAGQDSGIAIEVKEATKQGYAECRVGIDSVNFSMPNSKTRRGRVGQEIANTLDTSCNQGIFVQVSEELVVYAVWYEKYQCYIAIRRLTPLECFRLQGWTDDYFEKAEFVNSDSQLYKQAGNGVTVNVIKAIAENLENKEKN